jgi:DNA-directed RNA polymerase subunit RPC12/RpoP
MEYSYVKCPTCGKKYRMLNSFIERKSVYINKMNNDMEVKFDIRKTNPFSCLSCWKKLSNVLDEHTLNIFIGRIPLNKDFKKRLSEIVSRKL